MKTATGVASAAVMLLLAGCQSAPAGPGQASDAILARYLETDEPGCSAAVGVDGAVVWAGARGAADLAGQPLTTASIFDIASVSKQFTGVAVLLLEQDGALSLDDPLSR